MGNAGGNAEGESLQESRMDWSSPYQTEHDRLENLSMFQEAQIKNLEQELSETDRALR